MANTPSVRFCKFLSSSGQRNHLHGYAVGRCGFSEMAVSEDTGNAPVSVATLPYAPVLERIRQVPRVENAALVTSAPLQGMNIGTGFTVVGQAKDPANKAEANVTAVSGVYARTPGTPIVRGRMVGDGDTSTTPFVIAINETLANKYFAGKDPLGKQMNLGGKDTGMIKPYTIVGILDDRVDSGVGSDTHPTTFVPQQQVPTSLLFYQAHLKTIVTFVVKTRGDIPVAVEMHSNAR
jgi:putative ABC transport system permease protein